MRRLPIFAAALMLVPAVAPAQGWRGEGRGLPGWQREHGRHDHWRAQRYDQRYDTTGAIIGGALLGLGAAIGGAALAPPAYVAPPPGVYYQPAPPAYAAPPPPVVYYGY